MASVKPAPAPHSTQPTGWPMVQIPGSGMLGNNAANESNAAADPNHPANAKLTQALAQSGHKGDRID